MSISCDSGVDFSIDQHNLTIIEADGSNTEPLVVDSVTILAGVLRSSDDLTFSSIVTSLGQRYSVVVSPSFQTFISQYKADPNMLSRLPLIRLSAIIASPLFFSCFVPLTC